MTQLHDDLGRLETEACNPETSRIETLDTLSLCHAFHREEARVVPTIKNALQSIASFIDDLVPRLRSGGRLVYVGAGNSGRVALMDCTELPVTFSVDPSQFLCIVAGSTTIFKSSSTVQMSEGAEDSGKDGAAAIEALNLGCQDTVLGISASGRTPFVVEALRVAVSHKALTAVITNVQFAFISQLGIDHTISAPVGPEFVTGSTRLKAGTAAKVILNMISTCTMVRLGKTYNGLMVDVCTQNQKLRHRARRIVRQVCLTGEMYALNAKGQPTAIPIPIPETHQGDMLVDTLIQGCGGSVKVACAVALSGLAPDAARKRLDLALNRPSVGVPGPVPLNDPEQCFLAIDGGGTKCTASLAVWRGTDIITAQGTSGPCNMHCVSLEDILDRIQTSTTQAVAALRCRVPGLSASLKIVRVWVGVAGVDNAKEAMLDTLTGRLEKIFHIAHGSGTLRLSSDGMLLSACLDLDTHMKTGLSVVAGTGSVALAFGRDPHTGKIACRGKVGGWGYLLGDEGSAFDIGKRALQVALTRKEMNNSEPITLSELERELLLKCGCASMDQLLPGVLQASGSASKRMIADLAVVVTRLAFRAENPDLEARAIIYSAIEDFVRSIRRLLMVVKVPKADPGILILSGSLMNLASYRSLFLEAWELQGLYPFLEMDVIKDPSTKAAEVLARYPLLAN
ncbi:hypothetical protein BJX63DRAFT_418420 [Aspergillus granulosus]|uniref:N-acetyl-D-glucosamine kinase n=1 Tax=Aspergillus granulosus TaxID=176169 RepID=A0ABR4HXS4_9EURO